MGEPVFAGERLGLGPLDIRAGLSDAPLPRTVLNRAWYHSKAGNPMAPEGSGALFDALGAVEPAVTFGM